MKMITTMAFLVIAAPFVYLVLFQSDPYSFWVKNFVWIMMVLLLGVFLLVVFRP
ncbi:MAG: hypothetical protein ACUVQZ_07830 [Candidatus Caldatribacteriaceae bacterium]